MRRAVALGCALWTFACSEATPPGGPPRTFRMGFSAIPPRPDLPTTLQALDLWTSGHADAAILHVSVPYAALLAGFTAKQAVDSNELGLANYYRANCLCSPTSAWWTRPLGRNRRSRYGTACWPCRSRPERRR